MFQGLTGWHLVIVLAVVLLLFGAPKLPGLARSIGQSMRIFRSEVKTMKDENGNEVVIDEVEDEPEAPVAVKKPATKPTTAKSTSAKASTTKAPKNTTSKP